MVSPHTFRNLFKPKRLNGQVAILTASTNGIGFSIAERFAAEGASVVVSSRRSENVEKAVKQLNKKGYKNVLGVKCHVSDGNDRKELFQQTLNHFGKYNIFVSNAAVNPYFGRTSECPIDIWDKIFDVNVRSSYLLCQEAIPKLKKQAIIDGIPSNILLISSVSAYVPQIIPGPYPITKAAILSLTKSLCFDLALENVRVNCIAPGLIKTKFGEKLITSKKMANHILDNIPSRRFGEPEEISGIAAFLVSKDASYVNGKIIIASGGFTPSL